MTSPSSVRRKAPRPRAATRRWRHFSTTAIAMALTCALLPALPVGAATTAQQLATLRRQIAATQHDADQYTARYEHALAQSAVLQDEIASTTRSVHAQDVRVRALRAVVRERAVLAYMAAGSGSGQLFAVFGASDALQVARTSMLMGIANQKNNDVIAQYRKSNFDLRQRVAQLTRAQHNENKILVDSQATAKRINQRLVTLEQLREQLRHRQSAEQAAQRASAARAAALAAGRTRATIPTTTRQPRPEPPQSPSGPPSPPPTGGTEGVAVCPIRGPVSFTDTWHDPRPGGRFHEGVDLLSPFGTPNVAVTSGRIVFNSGPNEGNGIFLYGDNGNTYYYFHLSSYAGGPRHVQTGEVIGYVGATGDTTANHTHFEIHPGGGPPMNPYPAARRVC